MFKTEFIKLYILAFLIALISTSPTLASQNNTQPLKDKINILNQTDYSENLQVFLKTKSKDVTDKNYSFFVEKIDNNYVITIKKNKKQEIRIIPEAHVNDLFQGNMKYQEQLENQVLKIIFKPGPK